MGCQMDPWASPTQITSLQLYLQGRANSQSLDMVMAMDQPFPHITPDMDMELAHMEPVLTVTVAAYTGLVGSMGPAACMVWVECMEQVVPMVPVPCNSWLMKAPEAHFTRSRQWSRHLPP